MHLYIQGWVSGSRPCKNSRLFIRRTSLIPLVEYCHILSKLRYLVCIEQPLHLDKLLNFGEKRENDIFFAQQSLFFEEKSVTQSKNKFD